MMKMWHALLVMWMVIALGCNRTQSTDFTAEEKQLVEEVDQLQNQVSENVSGLNPVAIIDHARLARKEGVVMPPSVVTIVSDPVVNSSLVQANQRVALDLPHKFLTFAKGSGPVVAFADGDFMAKRHAITDSELLEPYDETVEASLNGIPEELRSPVDSKELVADYGIVELTSDYSFDESIERLKEAVLAQSDTVWFGEVDFQSDAAELGIEIGPTTLLLFGGPAPGGKAMAKYPKLGLDAFCQKLLVYEQADGVVRVIYNDIVAFAELHYGSTILPHRVINRRLSKVFEGAVTRSDAD